MAEGKNTKQLDMAALEVRTLAELRELAKEWEISGFSRLKKEDLILRLLRAKAEREGLRFGGGVLDIVDESKGYLRCDHYKPGPRDVYVSQSQIRRFGLRTGDMVVGQVRPPKESEKYFSLLRVEAVNGMDPEAAKKRPLFESLTPIFPEERFVLETTPNNLTTRLLSMIAPVGKGQRGLIVSPPKAGKTTVLKHVANGITANHPEVHLMDVEKLGKTYGGRICFRPSLNQQHVLVRGTVEQIQAHIEHTFDALGRFNGGLVAWAFIPPDMPLCNVEAFLKASSNLCY